MMPIIRKIRAKVASSVSGFEEPETFLWIKLLRDGEIDYREIETFSTSLWETNNIPLKIDFNEKTSTVTFNFKKIKKLKLTSNKLKLRSKTHPIFFDFGNISVSNNKLSSDQDVNVPFAARIVEENGSIFLRVKNEKNKEVSRELTSKLIDLNNKLYTTTKNFSHKNAELKKTDNSKNFTYIINAPQIINYFSQYKPKIYNTKLFSKLEYSDLGKVINSNKLDLLDKLISIKTIDINKLKFKKDLPHKPLKSIPRTNISETEKGEDIFPWKMQHVKLKMPSLNQQGERDSSLTKEKDPPAAINKTAEKITEPLNKINRNIKPKVNVRIKAEEITSDDFFSFQTDGAKFLLSNNVVLSVNEPGVDHKVQVILAIKKLLKGKEIKSALIVANHYSIGDTAISEKIGSNYGWYGNLKEFAPELDSNIVNSSALDILSDIAKPFQVQIVSYSLFATMLRSEKFKKEPLKNFECLIFDCDYCFRDNQDDIVKFINFVRPKFNWIITNLERDEYTKNISPALVPDVTLSHSYDEIRKQLPVINETEFWLDLEHGHHNEYNNTLFLARNSLQNILETGNPFRFQSQVFFYIHQLSQASNIPADNNGSNKTKLLLYHISSLKSHNKRAIIFSQYDKAGIQEIAKLLSKEKISYIKYSQGMNPNELSKAVSEFERDQSVTVFLADTRAMKTKSNIVYAPYIIYFDQWWAPISRWDFENKIYKKFNKPITVLNYFTQNTLDEEIRRVLLDKKLLDRETYGNTGADAYSKLLDEDEWIRIFGLEKKIQPPIDKKDDENDSDDI